MYSNLNQPNSILVCKELFSKQEDEYVCKGFKDLQADLGRTIPPYFEEARKESSLKVLNINNIKEKLLKENYKYLVINMPIWFNKNNKHQIIVKLDWYKQKERVFYLETLPERLSLPEYGTYFRYYLKPLNKIWQAYDLVKKEQSKESCDNFLSSQFKKKINPLSASCLHAQFYEPISVEQVESMNEQVLHSQAIQSKSKNLQIKLTLNNNLQELTPFIDLIRFDPKHLIHFSLLNELLNKKFPLEYDLAFSFNLPASLGQMIRFHFVNIPSYLVFILQVYYFLFKTKIKRNTWSFLFG